METGTISRIGNGAPLHGESAQLLTMLDAFEANPHMSLLTLEDELDVDLGLRLGFEPGLSVSNPQAVMNVQLSAEQYEAIKSFEELVRIFCNHSIYSPRELGLWLNEPRRSFRYKRPMDVLFEDFTASGFNRRKVAAVLCEGDVMFGIHPYDEAHAESLLGF